MHNTSQSRQKGQSTVEYAILAAVVIAALLAMQIYMKRGVQGKLRDASDQIGDQYVPLRTTSTFTITRPTSTRTEVLATTGQMTSTLTTDESQTRSGTETVDTSGETKLFTP